MAPDSTEGWRGPSRGDFLMLPPMKLNAHIPQRLLHPASDYAVTRRNVKVSERTMAHGVDSDFQGMLRISHTSSDQPRAPKSAQPSPDLSSRTRPAPAAEDEIATPAVTPMQTFSTPASAPRKARATQATKPPSPLGSTQRSVNRTIGRPQDRKPVASPAKSTGAPGAETESSELSDTTVSAIMNDVTNSSASPIADQRVRRRDGQSSVISKAPTKSEAAKAATQAPRAEFKALPPAASSDASSPTPAIVNPPQAHVTRNGVPVPPELAPAPVAKDDPVAPAEIPLVTRKRSRDSLADPVAVAAAKKIAEAAAVAEVEAKAASDRARDMTPVQARPLGSSTAGTSEDAPSSEARTIVGSIVESTNPSRGGTPKLPSGRADVTAPRRTAPSVEPLAPALESAIVEPSQSEPEEIALSARSAPAAESNASSNASESRSTSAPASTAGVQRRASSTPPVVAPASQTPTSLQQPAQGSSPAAGITAQPNGSTVSSGITAEPHGSTAAAGISADAQTSTPAAGNPAAANGSTVAAANPATAQGSHASSGIEASANGSTVSPSVPAPLETVLPSAANDAPEVALTARSTPHVDTVAAGSSPSAGISAPANGSSTPAAPAMTTNTSTSAAPTPAVAQGSTAAAGTPAPAQGSSTPAAPAMTTNTSTPASPTRAKAQGSTVAAGSPASSSSSASAPSSPVSAGVQRRASADSGSAPAPTASTSDSGSVAEISSSEGAPSASYRESVRASDSPEAPGVELVSRSAREASESKPAASSSAPVHQDPVPAARATSQSVPADVRAAVAAVAGSAPQNVNLKRGAHVDAHASAIKADAFTAKETVHVPGTAPLTSDSSRRLLAHELTHVVQQQKHGSRLPAENTPAGRALEAEALRAETHIGMPNARSGAVAGMPPFSSGSSSSPGIVQNARTSTPSSGVPAAAQGSSPGAGILATAQGSTPTPGLVARANGSSAAPANPASAHGSSAAAGTPAIARGSSPSAPAPIELAPRRPASPPAVVSGNDMQTVAYSGGGNPPPPGMPPVQRRASGMPPLGFSRETEMPPPIEPQRTPPAPAAPSQSANASPAPPGIETWRDHRWLERHASALYPLIRGMLRDELLRDRERRGKMMREY